MKTYAIIPFIEPPDDFVKRAREIDPDAYIEYEPKVIFVRVNASARYVAEKMGIIPNGDHGGCEGIVAEYRDRDTSGYGNKDLWEFLRK